MELTCSKIVCNFIVCIMFEAGIRQCISLFL